MSNKMSMCPEHMMAQCNESSSNKISKVEKKAGVSGPAQGLGAKIPEMQPPVGSTRIESKPFQFGRSNKR